MKSSDHADTIADCVVNESCVRRANTVHSPVSRRRHCCLEFHSLPAALQEVGDALDELQILQIRASAF